MQQNVRAFLFFIEKDLRQAGYDPKKISHAGFLIAKPFEVAFTADLGRPRSPAVDCVGEGCDHMPDGFLISSPCTGTCVVETIRYSLSDEPQSNGQLASGTTSVVKTFNGSTSDKAQAVVEGIEALEFLYNMNNGTAVTDVLDKGQSLADIRSVTVSLLIRTRNHLAGYGQPIDPIDQARGERRSFQYPASNAAHTTTGTRWGPYSDGYMRRVVITYINCPNMALQPTEE